MDLQEENYNALLGRESLNYLPSVQALNHVAQLVNLSCDLKKKEGFKRAIELVKEFQRRNLSDQEAAISNYFVANAWAGLRRLTRTGTKSSWDWQQEEIEKEIYHLRIAVKLGLNSLAKENVCQVFTNLGNLMDEVGRCVEAIEYWDRALEAVPSFGMAHGNKGLGLKHYSVSLYDNGHVSVFLKEAFQELGKGVGEGVHDEAEELFKREERGIKGFLGKESLDKEIDMHSFSMGRSKAEIRYREWCLKNKLFLNPLNDIGAFPIANRDVMALPPIVVDIGEGPYYQGFFNQMKQEFVSARYLFYEGITSEKAHFSDKGVLLVNTLDYPSYSLSTEKMKAAYRMMYSLLDKIAYFLNKYMGLNIPERQVSFRKLWYEKQNREKGLRQEFQSLENLPLRGLFWLSKDLFEDQEGFKETLEPDAQALDGIRHHAEHKYLKLHDYLWSGPVADNDKILKSMSDTLAFSVYREDFEKKALRIIKLVRAALIYLCLAVHTEERKRAAKRDPDKIVPGMPLAVWEDKWKV